MDILTQYYNSSGQIISKNQSLAKREFYRDCMAVHKYNEMFVPMNVTQAPTCTFVTDYLLYRYCYGDGIQAPLYKGGMVGIKEFNGERFACCAETTPDSFVRFGQDAAFDRDKWLGSSFCIEGSFEFGCLFKSPSEIPSSAALYMDIEFCCINSIDQNTVFVDDPSNQILVNGINFMFTPLGGSQIEAYMYLSGQNLTSVPFMLDGDTHEFICKVNNNGIIEYLVDSVSLLTEDSGASYIGCCKPYLGVQVNGGDNDESKFYVATGWVKKI